MYEVKIDHDKNRLYVQLSDIVSITDANQLIKQFESGFLTLEPGFTLINNLLDLKYFDEGVDEIQTEIMKLVKEAGVKNVIRIVPQNLKGDSRALMLDKHSVSVGYVSQVAHSVDEAEKLADKLEPKQMLK